MKDGLFHKNIVMPREIAELKSVTIHPHVSRHAREAAQSDRYGAIMIPTLITFSGADIIEAEITGGSAVKLLIRRPYDASRDIVFAVGFRNNESFLKSVWFNLRNDVHSTLKREIYNKSI